jgi:hypothetical protein
MIITSVRSFFVGFFLATMIGTTMLMVQRERVFITLVQKEIYHNMDFSDDVSLRGTAQPKSNLFESDTSLNVTLDILDEDSGTTATNPKPGDIFAPGSLPLSRLETYHKCYVDPCRYKGHKKRSGNMCDISEPHKMVYFLSAKCGSSTGRYVMQEYFNATEKTCKENEFLDGSNGFTRIAFSRDPYSRFFAGYQQAIKNMLIGKKNPAVPNPPKYLPDKYIPSFYDTLEPYTGLFGILATGRGDEILNNALQQFIQAYSGDIAFDPHLTLQVPFFVAQATGRTRPLDVMLDTKEMTQAFEDYADSFGIPQPRQLSANARQYSIGDQGLTQEEKQKICQFSAIDYCCLNYELPEECKDVVQCQWTEPSEFPGELLIEAVSPLPPADHC